MARISNFKQNHRQIEEGSWVSPGDEYDDLQIKTKGYTDSYTDARAAKLRRAAVQYSGDITRIPTAKSRDITVECLIAHCLQDVKNLSDENGKQIAFPQFVEMLRNPDYQDLVLACLKAAAVVGLQHVADVEDATKNSPKVSAPT